MKPSTKRWLIVAVLAAATGWLLWNFGRHGIDWGALLRTLSGADWRWVAASCAVTLISYYGRVLRWAVLIKPICPRPSHWRLFSATAIGFTGLVLFGRPGEFLRPYLIAKKEGLSVSSQMAAWLMERIYDLFAVLLVFGYALASVAGMSGVGPRARLLLEFGGQAIGVVTAILVIVFVALSRYSDWARDRLLEALAFLPEKHLVRARSIVNAFVEGAQVSKSWRSTAWILFYTALEWILIVVCYWLLFQAFPVTAGRPLGQVLSFLGFVAFGSMIQIPGVGGGVQVTAVLVLTELMGVALEPAIGIALMIWFITFVVIVPIGLALALADGLSWRALRGAEADAGAGEEVRP